MNLEDNILNRINQLLEQHPDIAELYLAVTSSFRTIYGPDSPQLRLVETLQEQVYNDDDTKSWSKERDFRNRLVGCLKGLKAEIEGDLIVNVQSEARGEVLGDFLILAREALNAGHKDVAAVLASAALEDTLKQCASDRGSDVQGKNMLTVVNALKALGVIRRNQGALLSEFVELRNDALHADWDKIDRENVERVLRFTEEFLAMQFSATITGDRSPDSSVDSEE